MSVQAPTYDELVSTVETLTARVNGYDAKITEFTAAKKGTDEDDKEMESKYKSAMDEMNHKDKKHMAEKDDMDKVKDAFKKAEDESDPEKKKEAMKKAIDEKKDYEQKHSKKGDAVPAPKDDKKDMEAKIANTIMKKVPLIEKILTATKIIDPTNYDKIEKQLTASTLEEVEQKYNMLAPYMAASGLQSKTISTPKGTGMIPFQAGLITDSKTDNIFEASVDDIDFNKISTKQIMEMYK